MLTYESELEGVVSAAGCDGQNGLHGRHAPGFVFWRKESGDRLGVSDLGRVLIGHLDQYRDQVRGERILRRQRHEHHCPGKLAAPANH